MFSGTASSIPAVINTHIENQMQQYAKDHPLEIHSLITSGDERERPLTFQEKMLKAYQGEDMENAIKTFPYLYDIYARKATAYQQASKDFSGLTEEKRKDAIESVMRQFDANAANTILHVDQTKFPRATYEETRLLSEMKARGDTAPLEEYHREDGPQR